MIGGVELNPGDASISLLLVKVSQVAFLLTFVVVCQDWKVEGAGEGVGGPQSLRLRLHRCMKSGAVGDGETRDKLAKLLKTSDSALF